MLSPDSAQTTTESARENAARAQAEGRFLEAAEAYLSLAPEAPSDRAPALFAAAWCLELAGRSENAVPLYQETVALSPEPILHVEALFRLGWIALQAGHWREAGACQRVVIDLADAHALNSPTVAHARYWHAVCLENEGQLLDAAERYAAVIDQGNPDLWHEAAYRRLVCLASVGDLRAAAQAADELVRGARPVTDPARLLALQSLARDEAAHIARALAAA